MKHFSLLKHLETILKKHNSLMKSPVTLDSNTSANPTRIHQCTTISKEHVTPILFNNYANHSECITNYQLMHVGNNYNVNNNHNCKEKNKVCNYSLNSIIRLCTYIGSLRTIQTVMYPSWWKAGTTQWLKAQSNCRKSISIRHAL